MEFFKGALDTVRRSESFVAEGGKLQSSVYFLEVPKPSLDLLSERLEKKLLKDYTPIFGFIVTFFNSFS